MWTKQTDVKAPSTYPERESSLGTTPTPSSSSSSPSISSSQRVSTPSARNLSCLGSGLEIKGEITGTEDLQIDCNVYGPVSLQGHRLTVGPTGRLSSEVKAREVIVHGEVTGNLVAHDRVEIKRDASVTGDVKASRISIEDGAHFKGRIEIDRGKSSFAPAEAPEVPALIGAEAN